MTQLNCTGLGQYFEPSWLILPLEVLFTWHNIQANLAYKCLDRGKFMNEFGSRFTNMVQEVLFMPGFSDHCLGSLRDGRMHVKILGRP